MAGTLDESTGLKAFEHIYVGDNGEYYELTDDLPKSPGANNGPGGRANRGSGAENSTRR